MFFRALRLQGPGVCWQRLEDPHPGGLRRVQVILLRAEGLFLLHHHQIQVLLEGQGRGDQEEVGSRVRSYQ